MPALQAYLEADGVAISEGCLRVLAPLYARIRTPGKPHEPQLYDLHLLVHQLCKVTRAAMKHAWLRGTSLPGALAWLGTVTKVYLIGVTFILNILSALTDPTVAMMAIQAYGGHVSCACSTPVRCFT